MEAERRAALTNAVKNSILFSLLGTEGQHRFGSHPIVATLGDEATAHAAFQEAVKAFFKKPMNIARACLDFHQHCQGQSETASEFVSALRELAPDCDFLVDYLKRELALQILSGCHSTKARECMLLAAIDLDEYIKILESDESLQEDSRIFAAAAGVTPHLQYTWYSTPTNNVADRRWGTRTKG